MLSFFLILCSFSFISLFFIIFTNNSIYALWGLITHFFLTALIFFFLGIEFIGIIILIIYIGAIAVLFIFGVMLLDTRNLQSQKKLKNKQLPGFFILSLKGAITFFYLASPIITFATKMLPYHFLDSVYMLKRSNTLSILGESFIQEYSFLFFLSGLSLFLALFGAVSITLAVSTKSHK
jgi:NADH-quinone oxidoreductase subunit J